MARQNCKSKTKDICKQMFYAKCAKNEQSVDGGHKWIVKYHGNLKQFFSTHK